MQQYSVPCRDGTVRLVVDATDREAEILRLLCRALADKEIAAELHIATSTVAGHLEDMYRALGLPHRLALALWALQHPAIFWNHHAENSAHEPGCLCPSPYCVSMRPPEPPCLKKMRPPDAKPCLCLLIRENRVVKRCCCCPEGETKAAQQ